MQEETWGRSVGAQMPNTIRDTIQERMGKLAQGIDCVSFNIHQSRPRGHPDVRERMRSFELRNAAFHPREDADPGAGDRHSLARRR
jgi:hypothetical protein